MEQPVLIGELEELVIKALREGVASFDQMMMNIVGGLGSPTQRASIRRAIARLQEKGIIRSLPVQYQLAVDSNCIRRSAFKSEAMDIFESVHGLLATGEKSAREMLAMMSIEASARNLRLIRRAIVRLRENGLIERTRIDVDRWAYYRLLQKDESRTM